MGKKYTLEQVRYIFEKEGYKLVADTYTNKDCRIHSNCPAGHDSFTTLGNFLRGTRCLKCSGSEKLTYGFVKNIFEKEGYSLISDTYKSNSGKLDSLCPEGHVYTVTYTGFVDAGTRCTECSGLKKYTLEEVKEIFVLRGFTLLSTEYNGCKESLKALCPVGHTCYPNLSNFNTKGRGCLVCSGSEKWDIEEIRNILKEESYSLLSTEYANSGSKISLQCLDGHNWNTSWENYYLKGARCPECQGLKRRSTKEVSDIFQEQGYKLITDTFINAHQKLHVLCINRHDFYTNLNSFTNPGRKSRCQVCFPLVNETICRKVFESLFNKSFSKSRPVFLLRKNGKRGLELDGFSLELKLAFEYDGEQHFNPVYGAEALLKIKRNDRLKNRRCKKAGVTLIRIPYTIKNKEKYIKEELIKKGVLWPAYQS